MLYPQTLPLLNDMALMEEILINSNVNYTIVRPVGLTNDLENGNYLVEPLMDVDKMSWRISRDDVSSFFIKCLTTEIYDWKIFTIASKI
ncbi:hypothetical protein MXB_422 [Myxobolus squamalis]|nr:hypothetical protein MXB_422 [Myxobolus squamalis]